MQQSKIYNILTSKSSNVHYIKRYIKFINSCYVDKNEYTEIHHVCPKANDLFPEYTDIEKHPWNAVKLNSRQHIIAHVMLWKIFGNSQIAALNYMLNVQNESTGYNCRKVPESIIIRYASKLRNEYYLSRKGKAVYKDHEGNKYLLDINDLLIEELNLVGNNKGHNHSEESRQKMSNAKIKAHLENPDRMITLYRYNEKIRVKLFSDEYNQYIDDGWEPEYTDEFRQYVKDIRYSEHSNKMKNRTRYMTVDGQYVGSFYKDDPIIKEQNLIVQYTENNKKQLESIKGLAVNALLGSQIYNNGVVEKRFKEDPDDPQWILGRLPRSESHSKNQKEAARKATLGMKFWNDGNVCIKVPAGQEPVGTQWKTGMLKRKY